MRPVFASSLLLSVFVPGALAQLARVPSGGDPSVRIERDARGAAACARVDAQATLQPGGAPLVAANWSALGPFGGDISDVQVSPANPSIVLAGLAPSSGAAGGLYRSTNAGASWSSVANLAGESVYDLAFDPSGIAYAGTLDSVWKSTDGGATWTQKPLGIGLNDQVLEVSVDPTNALRIWVGVADALGSQPVNVMLSTDGGTSWSNKTPPLGSAQTCQGIAVDPTNQNKVCAVFGGAFGGGQVWVSSDGGASWANRSAGLPSNPMREVVHDGTRLLVCGGQLFGSQIVGVWSSSNDGLTWSELSDASWPNRAIQDLALDPANPNTILVASAGAGVFRSTSGGASGTWSFGVGGTGSLSVNAISFSGSSTIFLGNSSNAVWKSTDAGTSFAQSSAGIGALDGYSVASNPLSASELAVAFQGLNDGGVYTSLDGGTSWSLAALPATRYSHVSFSPQGTLYAISSGPTTVAPEGLYRRTGSSWSGIGPDQGTLYESELFSLRVSRNDANLIWACGSDFGVAGAEPTIWRTANGGASWSKVYEGVSANEDVQDLEILDPAADLTLLAAFTDFSSSQTGGVLRSIDGGLSWNPVAGGIPASAQCYSIARSPQNPARCWATNSTSALANVLYTSVDGGQNWTPTGFSAQATRLVPDPIDPAILYVATNGAVRARATSDGGASFAGFDTGLTNFLRDLQLSGGGALRLYAAGPGGVFSTNIAAALSTFCAGDGSLGTGCPCANNGLAGRGCANSVNASGAQLALSGSVAPDSVVLAASGMLPTATAIYLQGTALLAEGVVFGDGVRCVGGTLKRLAVKASVGGASQFPAAGDPSISARSAALGDAFGPGAVRYYQTYFRDPDPVFCAAPAGNTWNATNGGRIVW